MVNEGRQKIRIVKKVRNVEEGRLQKRWRKAVKKGKGALKMLNKEC